MVDIHTTRCEMYCNIGRQGLETTLLWRDRLDGFSGPSVEYIHHRWSVIEIFDVHQCVLPAQVGRVLDELQNLGLENNTMVILHADHGCAIIL